MNPTSAAVPRLALSGVVLLASLAVAVAVGGCRSPEDRAMDRMERDMARQQRLMDRQMKAQARMMKQMEQSMEQSQREMERAD
jgi:hypothetical protein